MRFTDNKYYIMFVFFVVQPMNGMIIERRSFLFGVALIAMQALWFWRIANCAEKYIKEEE